MKVWTSFVALAVCAAVSLSSRGASNPMGAQPTVTRGAWCSDFTSSKAYADENNIPMVVFWANPGCSQCEKLEAACKKAEFTDWMASRQLVMVFGYGASGADMKACKAFAKSGKEYPFVAVYWKANTAGEGVLERFTGRSGKFGHGTTSSQALWEQFAGAVDNILADWKPTPDDPEPEPEPPVAIRAGGAFLVPDVAGSRLEAIAGVTASVEVPLVRTNASSVVTNVLTAGASPAQEIVWAVGESNKTVVIDVTGLAAGDALPLTLALDGAAVATSSIHGVAEGENAASNPKAPGEAFGFGEWTLDYDAARRMAAADATAKLLVLFSGPLWCPYCIGIENTLLNTDEFRAWARDNRVILALMEQGRAATPSTAVGLRGPRLTTYDPDPKKLANGECVSGAAYRSRKGISEAVSERLIEQTASYTVRWLAPDATAARLGNPTILLVDPETEEVCARFNGAREGTVYDVGENIGRLDALLTKAGQREVNRYPQTTTLVHTLSSTSACALDVNEASACYSFRPRVGAIDLSVVSGGSDVFTLSVLRGTDVLATGTNAVSFVATSDDVAAGLFVKVEKAFATGERTATGAFSSAFRPLDTDNEFVAQAFSTVVAFAADGQTRGTVSLSSTKKGKVRAKVFDAVTQKSVSLSGCWSEPDALGQAVFAAEKARQGVALRLALEATGDLQATVSIAAADGTAETFVGVASVADVDFAAFADTYTVALPVESAEGAQTLGAGSVTVKAATSLARRTGSVLCSVRLPDGKLKSVRGQLTAGTGGYANLVLSAKSGKTAFVIPLALRPNAALAPTRRAVVAPGGCSAVWTSTDKKSPFVVACGVYGSRYDKTESLINCCGTTELELAFDLSGQTDSTAAASVVSALGDGAAFAVTDRKIVLEKKISKFSLSFSRTAGTLNGKTRLVLSDSRTVSATLKGILFFDWYDCGCFDEDEAVPLEESLAQVYGTCLFTDKVGGRTVTRSIPFLLTPRE